MMTEDHTLNKRHILLVLDNLESDWVQEVLKEKDRTAQYHLLTFGFSPEQAFLRYETSSPGLRQKINVLDTKEISVKAEKHARDFYLNLMKEFPRRKTSAGFSISETLSDHRRNFWWYLLISEKSIWIGNLIHRIYALFRFYYACETRKYDGILFYVNDTVLRSALIDYAGKRRMACDVKGKTVKGPPSRTGFLRFIFSYALQVCRECVKLLLKLSALRLSGIKSNTHIPKGAVGFFSVYPFWWRNPFSENATDLIFNTIPDDIAQHENVKHIIWLMPGMSLFGKKEGFSNFSKRHDVILLENMIGFSDIAALFKARMFCKFFKALQLSAAERTTLLDMDIKEFIREDLFHSLTAPMFFQCLLIDRCLQRLPLENLKLLFFRIEFQPLERSVLYNTRGKTTTVGFQHSALGKNFLNYAFTDNELGDHWNRREQVTSMPLPDYIMTSGSLGVQYFRRAGYPEDRLDAGGAVRYGPLFEYAKNIPAKHKLRSHYAMPSDKKIIFVATTPLIQETACMLNDLFMALQPGSTNFHIILKFHPGAFAVPGFVTKIHDTINIHKNSVSLDLADASIPLYDYISLSDAVLLSGGTVALEAMLLGCVPIIYINNAQFSHNPMTDYSEAVMLVQDSHSLREALAMLNSKEAVQNLKNNWNKPLSDMFYHVAENPNQRFLSVAKNVFHIL